MIVTGIQRNRYWAVYRHSPQPKRVTNAYGRNDAVLSQLGPDHVEQVSPLTTTTLAHGCHEREPSNISVMEWILARSDMVAVI
jgi:hypothetical protein